VKTHEWQFDGLVGPTHNYAGLAYGNKASAMNAGAVSNPRAAALQGLDKMAFVRSLGIKQAFLPPQKRPLLGALKPLGFTGNVRDVLNKVHQTAPELLASVYSSAYMWTANAATITPSADSADGKLHLSPANLISNFHRSLEPAIMLQTLRAIFHDKNHFNVHDPLPASLRFSDEGAANHMRIAKSHGEPGMHLYVYGMSGDNLTPTRHYPPRQHFEAFQSIARAHTVPEASQIHLQQSVEAIDAGVFHHDVIGMNTTRLMISHEKSFADKKSFLSLIEKLTSDISLHYIEISNEELPLSDAVKSYFFNSQLLELDDGRFMIVAPAECRENASAQRALEKIASQNTSAISISYRDVRESMRNGGGPACLRLRVVLTEAEAAAMHQGIVLTEMREQQLRAWVNRYYRDRLSLDDLRDPQLVDEVEAAHEALSAITGIVQAA